MQQHDTFKEPHVAQHPMATMGMNEAAEDAYAGVERPRHAVVNNFSNVIVTQFM